MASFRQECPSCGDLVLLDSKLAGKKTDCPKCKFRFIVSDPRAKDEEEDIDDEEGDDEENQPRKKKANNTPLIAGIAVGAVALLGLIGGGAYFLMSGGETAKPATTASNSPAPGGAGAAPGGPGGMMPPGAPGGMMPPGGPGGMMPPGAPGMEGGAPGIAGAGGVPGAGEGGAAPAPAVNVAEVDDGPDASNLLPADSQAVFRLQMDKARSTSLGSLLLQAPGTLDPASMEATWGFGPDNIKQIAVGMNLDRPWNLAVFRLEQPGNVEEISKRLNAQPQAVAGGLEGQGATVYLLPKEVDASTSVFARMVNLMRVGGRPTGPLGLYQVDDTNLVIGDLDRLKTYVQSEVGKLKRVAEVGAPPALVGAPGAAGGGADGTPPMPGAPSLGGPGAPSPGGFGKMAMGGGPPMGGSPGGAPTYPGMAGQPGMPGMAGGAGPGAGGAGAGAPSDLLCGWPVFEKPQSGPCH